MTFSFFSVSEAVAPGTMILWGGGAGQYVQASAESYGSIAMPGWLYCDGITVLKSAYPSLYAAIGDRYNTGGEGPTVFRLPGHNNTMWLHTNVSTNAEYTFVSAGHSHPLPNVSTHKPNINALSSDGHNHNFSIVAGASVATGGHTHTSSWARGSSGTGNVAGTVATGGGFGTSYPSTAHTHTFGTLAPNDYNADSHNHTAPANLGGTDSSTHNHTEPTTTASVNAGTTSHVQPTIAIWHLIKV